MSKAAVIGIDVGTTNLKLTALDTAGRTVARASVRYTVETTAGGFVTQDPQMWWIGLETCLAEAARQCALGELRAITFSCQGETLVCCDDQGAALEPAISWMDTRAYEEKEELAVLRDDWYERTGKPIGAYSTLAKIMWLKKHRPDFYAKVGRFCQVADYLTARLTGTWILDINNAAFTSQFDIRQRQWDEELCDQFGLRDKLPPVAESGAIAGTLRPELAREWGLGNMVQVVLGGHDQGCAALGAAPPNEPSVILSTGTAWVLYCPMREPRLDPGRRLVAYCHARPGQWAALAAYSGGGVLDAFLKQFCLGANGPDEGGIGPDYDRFIREENLCEDLIVIPFLFGAVTPDNDCTARAAILNLGPHHTPGHVAMGIMEAIGFETRRNLELLRTLEIESGRIKMVGGACRSSLWPQMVADICRVPVDALEDTQIAPLGAAYLAGEALGLWERGELPQYPAARTFNPTKERTTRFERKFERYLNALRMERMRRASELERPA